MADLFSEIAEISEEQMDALFDETPNKTVSADSLIGGQQTKPVQEFEDIDDEDEEEEIEEKPKKSKSKKAPSKATPQPQSNSIEDIDLDEIPEASEDDEDEEEEEEKPKKVAKKKEEAPKEEAKDEVNPEVVPVLKTTVDFLVESGIWQDFEGRDTMEFDQETYAKLAAEQDRVRVQGMFEELVDSTGTFGKAIINFVKSGGNPDEIIDLFKEQKAVESISIDSVDGQKSLIKQYYTEVMGWKPEKADKYLTNLAISGELESEASEVKELYTSFYEKEAERINKDQEEFNKAQEKAEQEFASNIKSTIANRKDLSTKEKQVVEDYLLTYDQKLPNGKTVNKFYLEFAKMQANPEDYIDFALHVMDKQKFMQKISKKEETKATAKAFNFIKGNNAVSRSKGTSYESIKKNEKVSNFNWGLE